MKYYCPNCKKKLSKRKGAYVCSSCQGKYSQNGYLDFIGKNSYYWGEISPERMRKVLEEAKKDNWESSVQNLIKEYPGMEEYLLNHGRIDWLFHCFNNLKNHRALDVGSGWGSLAFDLTNYYDEVYSLESVKERVEFQAIRKEQDNNQRINIVRGDFLKLPFKENSFDLIAVNGVLEWVGIGDYSKEPKELQIKFIKNLYKLLKPGGCLYIGIENRYGIHYILGAEDHSGLPFTSLLPRALADIAVRYFRNTEGEYTLKVRMKKGDWKDYRTPTYSLKGYKELFQMAGVDKVEDYWTLFYSNPKFSGKNDGESFKFFLNYINQNSNAVGGIGKFLSGVGKNIPTSLAKKLSELLPPSYLFYLYKKNKSSKLEDKILRSQSKAFMKLGGSASFDSKINYFILEESKPKTVIKFRRDLGDVSKLLREEELAHKYGNMPKPELYKTDWLSYVVEDVIEAKKVLLNNIEQNKRVLEWIMNFQNTTKQRKISKKFINKEKNILKNYLQSLRIKKRLSNKIDLNLNEYFDLITENDVFLCSSQGDLCTNNILLSRKVHVLDWEDYKKSYDPLYDISFYFINILLETNFFANPDEYNNSIISPFKEPVFIDHINNIDFVKHLDPILTANTLRILTNHIKNKRHLGHGQRFFKILEKWQEKSYIDILTK